MAGRLPVPLSDDELSSFPGSRSESIVVPGDGYGYRATPNYSQTAARSCDQTPEHFWSFRALEARDNQTDYNDASTTTSGIKINANMIHNRRLLSRGPRSHSAGGSLDELNTYGSLGNSDSAPLLRDRSVSYDSITPVDTGSRTSQDDMEQPEPTEPTSMIYGYMKILNLWPNGKKHALTMLKIAILFCATILCCGLMLLQEEDERKVHYTILNEGKQELLQQAMCEEGESFLRIAFKGSFKPRNKVGDNHTRALIYLDGKNVFNMTVDPGAVEKGDIISLKFDVKCTPGENYSLTAASEARIPLEWTMNTLNPIVEYEVVFAFIILGFVYLLIVFEIVHRTLAAQLGALAALAVLSYMNQRPDIHVIISWIDIETLALLFGMMIIVSIFADTGFFDYSALQAYKLAKGKVWPLITLLCVFSAVVSAFLDNVTTILLMTPVTIRLCEVLNLDPKRILIAEVLFSNIGGTATAIGDPPNVIIVGALTEKGIDFSKFTLHMFPAIIIICFVGYGVLRLYYRDMNQLKNKDPAAISEMKHEVSMWRRAANRMPVFTREETVMRALFMQKAVEMEHNLNRAIHRNRREEKVSFFATVANLEREYYIKDVPLLFKCGVVLIVVIIFLFTYSFIDILYVDIGWIAVLGSIWLLVLADIPDFEGILHKIEWATLIFFAALFILMEALAELGLIKTIGDAIADLISTADEGSRLAVALILILWVSALASSFIDNIPYTTAMVPILQELSDKPDLQLPLMPMVVALAMGACLGGNGTLIGASCNVVCAGIADQHGYGFTFKEFFKIGFPMMLATTTTATLYILLCHVALSWNDT